MILTLEQAKLFLRVDFDDTETEIQDLIEALPSYLLRKTGKSWDTEPIEPMAVLAGKYIVAQWYDRDRAYEEIIGSVLLALKNKFESERE